MLKACLKNLPGTDLVIGAAAVGDFRPVRTARQKIKKTGGALTLRLVPNPDILKTLSRRRKKGRPVLAGFALETRALVPNARRKMAAKDLDLIVANGPGALDGARTRAVLITRDGAAVSYDGTKAGLAERILSAAEAFL
jgi:phosphopantothenoylcysteine decarboxylase/phosphopantothenate--cysteine ligase